MLSDNYFPPNHLSVSMKYRSSNLPIGLLTRIYITMHMPFHNTWLCNFAQVLVKHTFVHESNVKSQLMPHFSLQFTYQYHRNRNTRDLLLVSPLVLHTRAYSFHSTNACNFTQIETNWLDLAPKQGTQVCLLMIMHFFAYVPWKSYINYNIYAQIGQIHT